jgi:hypothetical protein
MEGIAMVKYPIRPKYFSQRFIRLMVKSAAAQTLTTDGFALLTVVVATEDARRYASPVAFYNEQLMMLLGFGSKKRLIAARAKAIAAGWLAYQAGGKGVAGLYYVQIPPELEQIPDGPSDESSGKCGSESELQTELKTEPQIVCSSESEPKGVPMRNRKGTPYIPSPNPNPKETRPRGSLFDPLQFELPLSLDDGAFRTAWGEWCEHRREIRKPLTPTSTKAQLRELASMGVERATLALRHTIAKGWQGIREPDQSKVGTQATKQLVTAGPVQVGNYQRKPKVRA